MKGYHVVRRFGWDTHGVPIEYEIDKKLGMSGRDAVQQIGIEKYNDECRAIVMRYAAEWRRIIERLGRWIDFDNDYKVRDSYWSASPLPPPAQTSNRTVHYQDYGRILHGVMLVGVQTALGPRQGVPRLPDHAVLNRALHSAQPNGSETKRKDDPGSCHPCILRSLGKLVTRQHRW